MSVTWPLLLLGGGAIYLAWFAIRRGRDVSIRIGGPKLGIHLETRPSRVNRRKAGADDQ